MPGIVYLMLKSWDKRGKDEDLPHIYHKSCSPAGDFAGGRTRLLIPPPIQGLGAANGFQMQVELTDGSYDFARLQKITDDIIREVNTAPEIQDAFTAFRANVPQVSLTVNSAQAATLNVDVGDVYNLLQSSLGSTYVNLFTRFGHNYMVYVQADPLHRLNTDGIKRLFVRSQSGNMVPVGALADIKPSQGPPLISLYNLFPSATINGAPAATSTPVRR